MTITEIKAEEVFTKLLIGSKVICIDFRKGEYLELATASMEYIVQKINSNACKFFVKEGN